MLQDVREGVIEELFEGVAVHATVSLAQGDRRGFTGHDLSQGGLGCGEQNSVIQTHIPEHIVEGETRRWLGQGRCRSDRGGDGGTRGGGLRDAAPSARWDRRRTDRTQDGWTEGCDRFVRRRWLLSVLAWTSGRTALRVLELFPAIVDRSSDRLDPEDGLLELRSLHYDGTLRSLDLEA